MEIEVLRLSAERQKLGIYLGLFFLVYSLPSSADGLSGNCKLFILKRLCKYKP